MPHVNIWIRKNNLAKWEAIPDKSNWVNTLLANSDDTTRYGAVRQTVVGPVIEVLSEVGQVPKQKLVDSVFKNTGFCEHGAGKGFCKVKGCKYYQFKKGK